MPKKVTIKEISVTGDKENCGHCAKAHETIPGLARKAGGSYKYNSLESQQGLDIAKKHVGKDGNVDIPIIIVKKEVCKKTACSVKETVITGFNEKKVKKALGL